MAQNFRRYTSNNVGTSATAIPSGAAFDSYDTIVGISVSNVTTSAVVASVYINDGSNDIYLVKDAPIPSGGSLELIDGGSKVVLQTGDAVKAYASAATSVDVITSVVDTISA